MYTASATNPKLLYITQSSNLPNTVLHRSHDEKRTDRAVITVNIIISGIAPKQNAFKFKIAPHKQKSIVKIFWHNGKSATGDI